MGKFIPNKQAAVLAKAAQMHGVLSKTGAVPADYGLTAQDVTNLGETLASAQTAGGDRDAATETKKSKTSAFSAAALPQLVAIIQDMGNKIRVSDATDDMAQAVGVERRKASPTPKPAPQDPPGITLDHLVPGVIYFRLHAVGSAGPRARAANAIGAQIAVVDGTKPLTAGEADQVPQMFVSRTLGQLDSTNMPAQVRIYARWQTQRGLVSSWSAPLTVKVN